MLQAFDPNEWCLKNGLLSGGLNPRPLSHESFALTTRPRLLTSYSTNFLSQSYLTTFLKLPYFSGYPWLRWSSYQCFPFDETNNDFVARLFRGCFKYFIQSGRGHCWTVSSSNRFQLWSNFWTFINSGNKKSRVKWQNKIILIWNENFRYWSTMSE